MADNTRSTRRTSGDADAKGDADSKPTRVVDADGAGATAASTGAEAPVLDPDSELGQARARDKAHSGGAIRAEDNTDAGRQPDGAAEASMAGSDPSVEETVEVYTTGDFMLHDPYSLDTVEATGSSTVRRTAFIEQKLASGQLKEGSPPKAAESKSDDE